MIIRVTDLKSTFTLYVDPIRDRRDYRRIKSAKKKIRTALQVAKERLGYDKLYPIPKGALVH